MKKTAVTGIKPTGVITLGNYIGAIKNFVQMQDEYEMMVFIANLHAITVPFSNKELAQNTRTLAAMYIACGLDPNKVNLFVQSDVLEHAQLGHILLCNTTMGELQKMTQFKDKSANGGIKMENGTFAIPTGLLTYPALMAADILLYRPEIVPVGDDQKQHVELTRNIAERINNKFGKVFSVPEPVIAKVGARIMSLTEPTKKMSKSDNSEKSYISLLDNTEVARKKILSAVTDGENLVKFDTENKPGVSNLMTIYASLKNISIQDVETEFNGLGYKEFKTAVADQVCNLLENIQQKYNEVLNSNLVDNILEKGAQNARNIAQKVLKDVQDKLGLNYRG